MSAIKVGELDFVVTQKGDSDIYTVSGKDAAALHAKMQQIPVEINNFVIGELTAAGTFTLQKIAAPKPEAQVAAG